MKPEVVLALYKPHEGKDAELLQILKQHVPTLRQLEMATDRPVVLVKTKNGSFLEIFEWSTAEASGLAHHHPEVAKVWEAIGKVADFTTLESLEEIKQPFPHFKPMNL